MFIIASLSTALIVNWRANERRYGVQRAAQTMVQTMRRAQDMAISGKKSSDSEHPSSYGLYFNQQSTNSYLLYADKNGNSSYQPADDVLIETMSLDQDIEIYSLSSGNTLDFIFTVPDGFTMINYHGGHTDDDAAINIRVRNKACPSGFCKSIIIRKTGEISIQ
jgi:hypothetical protein